MSKTESVQHAPWPWRIHPASPRKVVDANGAPVASCGRVEKVPDHVYKGYLANARLIAAAPELFSERQQISAELWRMSWNNPHDAEQLLRDFIEKHHYSDAVAKATGTATLDKAVETAIAEGRV